MRNDVMLTWIIPVYNGEKYLAQAIDSILRQPCGDFEILVIDDGSTDSSLQIARSYTDSRVKAIHKENGGVSSARNLGIENAKSRYIAFLDADDVVCKDAYDEEIHSILQEEKYDLLSFSYYNGDQNLRYGNRWTVVDGEEDSDESELDPFKHFCSVLYHHRLFEGEKAVYFPVGIKVMEDIAFHFVANHRANKIKNINRNWFVYRNNAGSAIHRLGNHKSAVQYSIPAWYWCKSQCDTERARIACDIRLFATVSMFIQMACGAGMPLQDIQKALKRQEVQETLTIYDILWNSSKAVYEEFNRNPQKYWLKQRLKGIPVGIMYFMAQLPGFRALYQRKKYKENIEMVV